MPDKAIELVNENESAIVFFTRGAHLCYDGDGNGTTGNWVVDEQSIQGMNKVIIYLRYEVSHITHVLMGDYKGWKPSPEEGRKTIMFIGLKEIGITDSNWVKFGGVGGKPVLLINN